MWTFHLFTRLFFLYDPKMAATEDIPDLGRRAGEVLKTMQFYYTTTSLTYTKYSETFPKGLLFEKTTLYIDQIYFDIFLVPLSTMHTAHLSRIPFFNAIMGVRYIF